MTPYVSPMGWRFGRHVKRVPQTFAARLALGGAGTVLAPTMTCAAFLQPEGAFQAISSTSYSSFSRRFDAKGRLRRAAAFSKTALDASLSYGLNQNVTLVGEASTDQLSPRFLDDRGAALTWSGLAGARLALWRTDDAVVSVQLLGGVGQTRTDSATGRAGAMADARLLMGRNIGMAGLPGFADVQLAYRFAAPGTPSEIRLDATLGAQPSPTVTLLAQSFAAYAVGQGGLPASWRIKAKGSVVWQFSDNWFVQLGAFSTLAGRNAAQENGGTLSLWRRF